MASLNKVILVGNLTKDPELRFIPSGAAVANLRIAMNRRYKNSAGEWKDEVCFIGVVVWNKAAEACGERLKKGSAVLVEGRLQSRSWEAEDGQKRSVLEVVSDRIQFLNGRPQSGGAETGSQTGEECAAGPEDAPAVDDIPF